MDWIKRRGKRQMGFIKLNRYGDPSGCVFDAAAVVEKARQTFPGAQVLPGDPLALSAERAAALGAADHVVRTLRHNQQEYGPACAFEITIEGGETIQGRARRYDVTFLFADSLAEEWRQRLLKFLQTLGAGRIEEATDHVATRA
jgi:hypothetical protein